jgi:NADH dehydrogenase [ubiquinone] 1 alpha subcomplex assembly factor 5
MDRFEPPQIFDTRRKRALRERAAAHTGGDKFLWQHMANDLTERLAVVTRDFYRVIMIGPIGDWNQDILAERLQHNDAIKVTLAPLSGPDCIDEELLPFDEASFDLVISAGTLDCVNDLPGVLHQYRRMLEPDGLFLGTMFGAGSLVALKSAMLDADGDYAAAHIHPQIELRSAADLLSRTGYALPVADVDYLTVRYASWQKLIGDLRTYGAGNAMVGKKPFLGRNYHSKLNTAWSKLSDCDGKVTEQFAFLSLNGWAPSASQPSPAKRGSGNISLADILKPRQV